MNTYNYKKEIMSEVILWNLINYGNTGLTEGNRNLLVEILLKIYNKNINHATNS